MKIDDMIIAALDEADAQPLEALLEGIETSAGAMKKSRIGRAARSKSGLNKENAHRTARVSRTVRFAAAAAALVLAFGAAMGVTAYAKEHREYREAISFFNECELPTEGMSKDSIREAYQSIARGRASGEASGLVIGLGKYRIDLSAMEPGLSSAAQTDLASLWSKRLLESIPESGEEYSVEAFRGLLPLYSEGTHYMLSTESGDDRGFGSASLEEYERGERVWAFGSSPSIIDAFGRFGESVVMVGRSAVPDGSVSAFVAVKNDESEKVRNIGAAADSRIFFSIVQNGASYAIFARDIDTGKAYMLRCNSSFAAFSETELDCPEGYLVTSAASFGEGYALLLRETVSDTGNIIADRPRFMIAIVDRYGEDIKTFSPALDSIAGEVLAAGSADNANPEGCRFYAVDILEYRGKLCVSGYLLANGSQQDHTAAAEGMTEEEYTAFVRSGCTALLIELDPEEETQTVLCLEAGAVGNSLRKDEAGMLVWYVCGIKEARLTAEDGVSHTKIHTSVYEYGFTSSGAVIAADTGARAAFLW